MTGRKVAAIEEKETRRRINRGDGRRSVAASEQVIARMIARASICEVKSGAGGEGRLHSKSPLGRQCAETRINGTYDGGNDSRKENSVQVDGSHQSSENDVGMVVAKAKRAASSLWMILHAQGCRFGGSRCPHSGCSATKKLLLHVKTCAAGPDFICPEGYHGCDQARKLLTHYRRCREIRARQAGAGRRSATQQQNFCLVCSLAARHARNALEGGKAPPPSKNTTALSTRSGMRSATTPLSNNSPDRVLKQSRVTEEEHEVAPAHMARSSSMQMMPPPPPRPRRMGPSKDMSSLKVGIQSPANSLSFANSHAVVGEESLPVFGSPPTAPQLMQRRIAAVAQATAPSPLAGGTADTSLLGKSYDSSRGSCLKTSLPLKRTGNRSSATSSSGQHQRCEPSRKLRRQRAESFDERSFSIKTHFSPSPTKPLLVDSPQKGKNDPTLEVLLTTEESHHRQQQLTEEPLEAPSLGRQRSVSCGVLSSLVRQGGCDTIVEEAHNSCNNVDERNVLEDTMFSMEGA